MQVPSSITWISTETRHRLRGNIRSSCQTDHISAYAGTSPDIQTMHTSARRGHHISVCTTGRRSVHETTTGYGGRTWTLRETTKEFVRIETNSEKWYLHFVKFTKSLEFIQSVLDNCLFIVLKEGEIFFLNLYVDDILICANNMTLLERLKDKFTNNFIMKHLGEVSQYLGIKITRKNEAIKVNQKQYMQDILKRFDIAIRNNDKGLHNTPME